MQSDNFIGKLMQRKKKIPNFSIPYGRHNGSVMAARLDTEREETKRAARSISPSPARTSIRYCPILQVYKKMTKLKLGKDRIDRIKYILNIEEKAKHQLEQRFKNNDYYFKYPKTHKKETTQPSFKPSQSQDYQLYKAIHDLTTKNAKQDLSKKAQFRKVACSPRIALKLPRERPKPLVSKEEPQYHGHLSMFLEPLLGSQTFDDLDDILGINQDSFFVEELRKKQLNIFQCLGNPRGQQFQSGWEQLDNHHFCFQSKVTAVNKHFNEEVCNHLSTFSRIGAVNPNSQSIPKNFRMEGGDVGDLETIKNSESIFLVANGLLTPESFQDKGKENGVKELTQITNTIALKGNQESRQTSTQNKQSELNYYGHIPLSKKEQHKIRLSEQCMKKLQKLIGKKLKGKQHCINDRGEKRALEREVEGALTERVDDVDRQNGRHKKDAEKRIRLNKLYKDKCQNVALKGAVASFRANNNVNRQLELKPAR